MRLNGKEDRPLFGQFRVITNKDMPKLSERTETQTGKFKKEKNETKLKWTPHKMSDVDEIKRLTEFDPTAPEVA